MSALFDVQLIIYSSTMLLNKKYLLLLKMHIGYCVTETYCENAVANSVRMQLKNH